MAALNLPRQLALSLFALATSSSVAAQTASDSHAFVGVKAGMNYEQAEDSLAGAAAAGGLFGGISLGLNGPSKLNSGSLRPCAIQ
jgi:hypothetical protein